MNIRINELVDSRNTVNKWMERFGVRFGVYKHGIFNEQLTPPTCDGTEQIPMGCLSQQTHHQGWYCTRGVRVFLERLYA